MNIQYLDESVRQYIVDLQYTRHDIYKLYMEYFDIIRHLEYDDFIKLVKEECGKSDFTKRIKELEPSLYEFRLPPHDFKGVLRIEFSIEDDYYTILILSAKIKTMFTWAAKKQGSIK